MPDNCLGGQNASLQVNNSDCACVSIASIVWNGAGTQFTITLNNGQSITSPDLTGETGPAPTISFRVSGTTLQYSINGGTSWVSIYDLLGIAYARVLHNDISTSATTGTSLEILKTYSMPAATLSSDGSYIEIKARFSTSTATTFASTKAIGLYFNGTLINSQSYTFNTFNVDAIEVVARVNRFSNVVGKSISHATPYYSTIPFMVTTLTSGFASIAGLNFTTTGYDITARANSDVIGDLTCENLEVTLYRK